VYRVTELLIHNLKCEAANTLLYNCKKSWWHRLLFLCVSFLLISYNGFAQDTSCTVIWYPAIQLSDSGEDAYTPQITLTGDDTVHVTWKGFTNIKYRLPYARSTDNGGTWETTRDLVTDTIEFPVRFFYNLIVSEGQKVYVFAANEGNNNREIAMTVSTDRGTTWNPTVRIGPDSAVGLYSANLSNDTLIVVYSPWQGGFSQEPRLIYSTDAGMTWTLTNDTLDGYTRTAYTSGTLHLVRSTIANNAQEMLYLRSYDLGNTFPQSEILSEIDGYDAIDYAFASAPSGSNKLVVSWRDARACAGFLGCTIIERASNDNGNSWTPEEVLTDEPWGFVPSVAVNQQGAIAVAWIAEVVFDTYHHVASRFKKDQYSAWFPIVDQTPMINNAIYPSIAVSDKAIHLAWEQETGSGNFRIFYRRGVFYNKTDTINYEQGWNLVSLPMQTDSTYILPSLFGYDGSYVSSDSMVLGKGYWAKPNSQISYGGSDVLIDTIDVKLGWNLIGSLTCPVHVSTVRSIPDSIIISNFFGYGSSAYYQSEIIEPGRAYWVKVSQAGKLILKAN